MRSIPRAILCDELVRTELGSGCTDLDTFIPVACDMIRAARGLCRDLQFALTWPKDYVAARAVNMTGIKFASLWIDVRFDFIVSARIPNKAIGLH
jgi:hypothetical protein